MKQLSEKNVKRLTNNMQKNQSEMCKVIEETFEEVYEQLETLEKSVGGFHYNEETETLTIPTTHGTVSGEKLIIY